jgi:hypothetical protein
MDHQGAAFFANVTPDFTNPARFNEQERVI